MPGRGEDGNKIADPMLEDGEIALKWRENEA
jgi:hypothetical protein